MDGERRHVEAMLVSDAAQIEKLLARHTQVGAEVLEIIPDHLLGKVIMTGRYRCVRGKHRVRRHALERGGAVDAMRDEPTHTLEQKKSSMALVDVPHRWSLLERVERAHATYAEDDLLLDTHLAIAAVEPMGDVAAVLVVLFDVGVEQVQLDMPALRLPHFARDSATR